MARRNHRKAIAILCLASIALLAGSCRTAPKPSPTKPIESPLLRFGQDRFLAGDFNAAALAFGDLIMITSDPDIQNEALYWRALSYIKLTRFQQAETDLLMVVDRTKENKLKANAFRALGDALLAQAKFKLAADILTKALTRHPNDVPRDEVLYKLALAHIRQGNHYEALPYLEDVSANYPDSDFADDAEWMIDNMGVPPEEIILQVEGDTTTASTESTTEETASDSTP